MSCVSLFYTFFLLIRWITFAPCLYIFTQYYFQVTNTYTTNTINFLSSIYMLIYPFAIQFTFKYFEDPIPNHKPGSGLRRGILIGAILNALAGCIRWLGAVPSLYGFIILFIGQTIAAVGRFYIDITCKRKERFDILFYIKSTSIYACYTSSTGCRMVSRR